MRFDLAQFDPLGGTATLRLDGSAFSGRGADRLASAADGAPALARAEPRRESSIRTLAQAVALLRADADASLCRFEVDDVLDRHQVRRYG